MAIVTALLVTACATLGGVPAPYAESHLAAAQSAMSADEMLSQIGMLSSDDFEGRAPGTRGEELTVDYLVSQFKSLGLAPGNGDGSYLQKVALRQYVSVPALTIRRGAQLTELRSPEDLVAIAPRWESNLSIQDSELVFVGYGVIAPEYGWDDYKGADLRGKTLVVLVNDPPIPDPANPSRLDDKMFRGRAMTYYGRWNYKYEMAEQLGAAAALIVHETIPAAYPYSVVVNSWGRENYMLATSTAGYPPVAGWLPVDRAREIFSAAGSDFEAMKARALRKDFRPVPLGATASFRVRNTWRDIQSHNVVARIEGSDPALKDEAVVYTAHWDHFGWDPKLPGPKSNQVYHGARDNAGGVAAILAVARAFKALPRAPRRSILFVATTAEERNFLGAYHYINQPIFPIGKTVANINIDGLNAWGRTSDVVIVGNGHSTLDELITEAARGQGRATKGELRPETGSFFRSDHVPFIRAGIPAAYFGSGVEFVGKPDGFAEAKRNDYIANRYHKVADVIEPTWDLSGAVQDAQLAFRVGLRVAEDERPPEWKPGSEFKAKRDEMRARR